MEQRREPRLEHRISPLEHPTSPVGERAGGEPGAGDRDEHEALLALGFPARPPEADRPGESCPSGIPENGEASDGWIELAGRPRRGRGLLALWGLRRPTLWGFRRPPLGCLTFWGLRRLRRGRAMVKLAEDERGAVTAEYALVIMAAVAFAGLLILIMRSEEVRAMLLSLVQNALGSAG